MKLVFFSVVLNQHQAPVADELWELTGHKYVFVELLDIGDTKGGTEDYSGRPYLLRAWDSHEAHAKAMELALTAEACVFSGAASLPFQVARMKRGLLSFEMGERWLKQGVRNLLSFNLLRGMWHYHTGKWNRKPLYKLCCSAYCASDQYRMHSFEGRCYKWGYFTRVDDVCFSEKQYDAEYHRISIMWCARYLAWKHPELPIYVAAHLKSKGYQFILDMYGSGELEKSIIELAGSLDVNDVVKFHGVVPNSEIRIAMGKADIFLFTSDRNEGWGAVANESMASGCVLVASKAIGSIPYLVDDGNTGMIFSSPCVDSSFSNVDHDSLLALIEKVSWLLENPYEISRIGQNAQRNMNVVWSPANAARSLLQLIADLKSGRETSISEGPCSKALPI